MKTRSQIALLILLLTMTTLTFGQRPKFKYTGQQAVVSTKVKSTGTLRILAIMVEFKKKTDDLTVGDGTFASIYKQNYTGKKILDPLPHDAAYFSAHLQFAKRYFATVSGNKLDVEYTVLPQVVTMDTTMRRYSPTVSKKLADSTSFKPIGDMMTEAWKKAAAANPAIDFSQYDLFAIFHAGVGRDVTMPGSLGNEMDIPSVYLDLKALQKFYGTAYQGIPVGNTGFTIKNSMILPQTENRETVSYGVTYLTQITINGLLVSSIASYLGLPDLFDTKTGVSAIGRFGLMDGQSIFAYNGAFPPAPSAWEKMDLGWVTPVTVTSQDSATLHVAAQLAAGLTDTTIVQLPITSTEYFLIENRVRDTKKDGARLTLWNSGSEVVKTFSNDGTGFYSYNVDSLYGVVTGVDEPDWAVPGSGILIWHIDQSVIDANRAADQINADKNNRGVNLMQASGAQLIGESYTDVFGDNIIVEGSEQDLWYKSNKATLYKNTFDDMSYPNSRSNKGAASLLTLKNFSDTANVMSVTLLNGNSDIRKEAYATLTLPSTQNKITVVQTGTVTEYAVQSGDSVFLLNKSLQQDKLLPDFSTRPVISAGAVLAGITATSLNLFDMSAFSNSVLSAPAAFGNFSSDPVLVKKGSGAELFIGTATGKVLHYAFTNAAPQLLGVDSTDEISPVTFLLRKNSGYIAVKQSGSGAAATYTVWDGKTKIGTGSGVVNDANCAVTRMNDTVAVLLVNNTSFVFVSSAVSTFAFPGSDVIQNFSVADLRRDGNPYLLFEAGAKLYAYNFSGALADNFPVTTGTRTNTLVKPAAVLTADNQIFIYALADNGLHVVSGKTGHETSLSPLALTGAANGQNIFFNRDNQTYCATIDASHNLTVWKILANQGTILYTGLSGDISGARTSTLTQTASAASAFMPANKTYNYPNPVYGKVTYFRFYLSENANVTIKLFDLAGDYVGQLSGYGQGGMDNEIAWDVTNIQSGVYLAHVEAAGVSGQKAHSVIKVAIIK